MMIMRDKMIQLVRDALSDYGGYLPLSASLNCLADHIVDNGILGRIGEQPEAPVALGELVISPETISLLVFTLNDWAATSCRSPNAKLRDLAASATADGIVVWRLSRYVAKQPEALTVSPATINLLVLALNANSRTAFFSNCTTLNTLRTSAIRDGIIKEVDSWTVEAPVAPIDWLGDDFDL